MDDNGSPQDPSQLQAQEELLRRSGTLQWKMGLDLCQHPISYLLMLCVLLTLPFSQHATAQVLAQAAFIAMAPIFLIESVIVSSDIEVRFQFASFAFGFGLLAGAAYIFPIAYHISPALISMLPWTTCALLLGALWIYLQEVDVVTRDMAKPLAEPHQPASA